MVLKTNANLNRIGNEYFSYSLILIYSSPPQFTFFGLIKLKTYYYMCGFKFLLIVQMCFIFFPFGDTCTRK